MVVKIRLARVGGKQTLYRIVATFVKSRRDGKHIEKLGTYDPLPKNDLCFVNLKVDRIKYWIGNGAQPTIPMARLLGMAGILPEYPEKPFLTKEQKQEKLEIRKARRKPKDDKEEI